MEDETTMPSTRGPYDILRDIHALAASGGRPLLDAVGQPLNAEGERLHAIIKEHAVPTPTAPPEPALPETTSPEGRSASEKGGASPRASICPVAEPRTAKVWPPSQS